MKCPRCQAENREGARFCRECGVTFGAAQQENDREAIRSRVHGRRHDRCADAHLWIALTAGTGLTSVAVDPMGQFRCVVNRGITGAEELLRCSASGVPRTSFPKVPAGCQRLCRDGAASASRGESWPRSAAGPPSGVLEGSVGRMSWCFFLAGRKDTMNNKRHVCRSTLLFVLS